MKVGRNLYLENCTNLTSLPEGLKVYGKLDLRNCTSLKSLPKGLEVYNNLVIHNSGLAKLSDKELREMVKPGFLKGDIYRG